MDTKLVKEQTSSLSVLYVEDDFDVLEETAELFETFFFPFLFSFFSVFF